jgi:hypothetical protein
MEASGTTVFRKNFLKSSFSSLLVKRSFSVVNNPNPKKLETLFSVKLAFMSWCYLFFKA